MKRLLSNLTLFAKVPNESSNHHRRRGGGGEDKVNETAIAQIIHDRLASHILVEVVQKQQPNQEVHVCCKDCGVEELIVHYDYSLCSDTVKFVVNPVLSSSGGTNKPETQYRHRLNGLFVCTASGNVHLCGTGRCKLPCGYGVGEDGSYVCLLTGVIVDTGEWAGKTWQQHDADRGTGEHLSWKADKAQSKKEVQGEKLWNAQFDSLKAEIKNFQGLLCELLPGGKHSRRIHAKINSKIVKRLKLKILTCIKGNLSLGCPIDIMKIKEVFLCAVRNCYIECNGLRVMGMTARQRHSIANAYTASIFNLYNEMSDTKWARVKGLTGTHSIRGGDSTAAARTPRRTMRFVQFGFNVLMLSQSGLSFNNNYVIKQDAFLKSALPCVHHIMKDDTLQLQHPYMKFMARSTKRMVSMFKAQTTLPFLQPIDACASACSNTELNFCAEGYHGTQQQFNL